jgi:hypothetical protein
MGDSGVTASILILFRKPKKFADSFWHIQRLLRNLAERMFGPDTPTCF